MSLLKISVLVVLLSLACGPVFSAAELEVGQMSFPSIGWGRQNAVIPLTNLAQDYRIIVAIGEAAFAGDASGPPRLSRKSFIIEPLAADTLRFPVEIPGNFGAGVVDIRLYDVVDTLDKLLESQKFLSNQLKFNIEVPPALNEIVQSGLQVPVFVARNGAFDNFLARIIAFLVHKGKSMDEISTMCKADQWYVKTVASRLINDGYLELAASGYKTNFAIIEDEHCEALAEPIRTAVANLYSIIVRNLPAFDSTLKAMVSAGTLTDDADDLFDGGSILYHKHPVISSLLLWNILGRDFVNDGREFSIFESSDLCHASMGDYMHMVTGDGNRMGKSFYYFSSDSRNEWFYCGTVSSVMPCDPGYEGRLNAPINMLFGEDNPPLYFSYNEDKLRVPLSILMDGTSEHLNALKKRVDQTFGSANSDPLRRGTRYWCWNLVVTQLMDRFEKENILEKEGASIYVLQRVDY
jgi:hypothetical protein